MVALSKFKLRRHTPPVAHKYHPRNRPKRYHFGKIITFLATPAEVFFPGVLLYDAPPLPLPRVLACAHTSCTQPHGGRPCLSTQTPTSSPANPWAASP